MNREQIFELARKTFEQGDPSSWFETLYADSNGATKNVPWADLRPNSHLEKWLEKNKGASGKGLVVGCGLGDDAECVAQHGFQTTSFDVSKTAIEWCKKRFPQTKVNYRCENLFSTPSEWKHSFDFIFEGYTVQALPDRVREETIQGIVDLVAPKGKLLVVCTGRTGKYEFPGPPWPLLASEMEEYSKRGLHLDQLRELKEPNDPFPLTFVGLYHRD